MEHWAANCCQIDYMAANKLAANYFEMSSRIRNPPILLYAIHVVLCCVQAMLYATIFSGIFPQASARGLAVNASGPKHAHLILQAHPIARLDSPSSG